uniref:Uncharacterized protein n=1 Tax=Arundo donax TaxID=35708 RepID=A0A0A9AFJ4_ARUDO
MGGGRVEKLQLSEPEPEPRPKRKWDPDMELT